MVAGRPHTYGEVSEAKLPVGLGQLVHPLLHDAPWLAHVQPHEALAAGAEHLTVVEGQMCLVDEEVEQLLMVEAELSAVEPHQE